MLSAAEKSRFEKLGPISDRDLQSVDMNELERLLQADGGDAGDHPFPPS